MTSKQKKPTPVEFIESDDDTYIVSKNSDNKTFAVSKSSDRVVLAKAIDNFSSVYEKLNSALTELKSVSTDKINEYSLMLETKKQDYNDLNIKMERDFKLKQADLDDKLKDINMAACEAFAKKYNYQLILIDDYEKKETEISTLQDKNDELNLKMEEKIDEKIELEKAKLEDSFKQDKLTLQLTHKAEIAELIAQNKQHLREIEILNSTITNMKSEIAEQRSLTREVAQAQANANANSYSEYKTKKKYDNNAS
jgi:hypothetical protein